MLAAIVLVGGCGDKAGTNSSVSGKVMLDNQPVAGSVVFVYGTEEKATAPIGANGVYSIPNPPKGQVKVLVRGMPGAAAPPAGAGTPKKGPEMATIPGTVTPGAAHPAKYASPATSDLTYEVKGGNETFDIPLKK